jgi:hypothetical protein
MPGKQSRVVYRCSFCGKAQDVVRRLIAGPGGVYICNECVNLCNEIIAEGEQTRHTESAQAADAPAWVSSTTINRRGDGASERSLEALMHELAEARAAIERLAGENGALRERLAHRQQ